MLGVIFFVIVVIATVCGVAIIWLVFARMGDRILGRHASNPRVPDAPV